MGSNIKNRIALDFFLIISIAIFPWWFSLLLISFGFFFFNFFYEALLFGIMIDSLYTAASKIFFGVPFATLVIIFILFLFVDWFKKELRL